MFETLFNGVLIDDAWTYYWIFMVVISALWVIGVIYLVYRTAVVENFVFLICLALPAIALVAYGGSYKDHALNCGPHYTEEHIIQSGEISDPITLTVTFKKCQYRTHYGVDFEGPYTVEFVESVSTVY